MEETKIKEVLEKMLPERLLACYLSNSKKLNPENEEELELFDMIEKEILRRMGENERILSK